MRLGIPAKTHAFTLTEMMIAAAIASVILAITLTSSIALQKSFSQVDNYFATHMQQIRIVDYLARDVKRGLSVTSSADKQTVVVKIPRYIIQAGDADATAANIGTPRNPTRLYVAGSGDPNVNYGTTTSTVEYKVSGSSILRTEDGIVTTIASSTDNLIPETIDIELANTEYTTTAITFKPISVADRSGTIVYSTAYLRNRRRPTL
ncbi:MAG: prepilin-type N-terminal cleavage/methylation domain-containing protein [Chthoniobacterales bacterium]|nr:prepilin-type N-terminal cleavage/methylation domain-containing protein [Chthoniobacterales bacterium]